MVACPICEKPVKEADINRHIDSECRDLIEDPTPPPTQSNGGKAKTANTFFTPASKKIVGFKDNHAGPESSPLVGRGFASTQVSVTKPPRPFSSTQTRQSNPFSSTTNLPSASTQAPTSKPSPSTAPPPLDSKQTLASEPPPSTAAAPAPISGVKRSHDEEEPVVKVEETGARPHPPPPVKKKPKYANAPLAERVRPQSLDDVAGQELVGPNGVLRSLMLEDNVPSIILWGPPGTGKTTIARCMAQIAGTRFVEINSTSSGVAECKKIFLEANNEYALTGRKTLVFCDEIHRFSKSQQDVFLAPSESGQVTLIGATTENPSFKVASALLSRCRTFVLAKLSDDHVFGLLRRALELEIPGLPTPSPSPSADTEKPVRECSVSQPGYQLLSNDNFALLHYLAAFADGDARTGLNLLELALDLCKKPGVTLEAMKKSLTQTLVYDRAGDQHFDTISAFHKSIRGSNADAALYYLARMVTSGEDPLYIARRMIVIASEDVGLADNSMLSLATATYTAAEKIGLPECRINLAHCAVALSLSPKSTRAYRGLTAADKALKEPGVAGVPIPLHLRNAPTELMETLGYGLGYKYNPEYVNGRVVQEYLPERLEGRKFLESDDLGGKMDPEIAELDEQLRISQEYEPAAEEMLLNPDGD
ncbi:hypothetical protein LTR08_009059 [Meristemomyces frigidus]|nr:hypothetical protein LTR08_009059 [Meristemomyces frigidus]